MAMRDTFRTVNLAAALILASALAGCAGTYGSLRWDLGVAHDFEAARVLPGHRYYTTGSESDPAAILALREERPLRGRGWREIAATPELLARLIDRMRGNRPGEPGGALVLDERGERIGFWYSYLGHPPPPRLLPDGGVELAPPPEPFDVLPGRPRLPHR